MRIQPGGALAAKTSKCLQNGRFRTRFRERKLLYQNPFTMFVNPFFGFDAPRRGEMGFSRKGCLTTPFPSEGLLEQSPIFVTEGVG